MIYSRPTIFRRTIIRLTTLKIFTLLTAMLSGALLAAQDSKPLPAPSPGQAIQDAAKAAAHDRPQDRPQGSADALYGADGKSGNVEVLTDTQGVNFGPYLKDVAATIRQHWYSLIPVEAQTEKGKLAIQFAIRKNGQIVAMKLDASSGDVALDKAAWSGIAASNPLPALPGAFTGPYLALRLRFLYNPNKADLDGTSTTPGPAGSVGPAVPVVHAAIAQSVVDSSLPDYPKRARADKVDGVVRLVAQIAPDGTVESAAAVEGNLILADAASQAIRKWRFEPARQNGKPVEDVVRIKFEFRLEGEQVRAWVVWPEARPAVQPIP